MPKIDVCELVYQRRKLGAVVEMACNPNDPFRLLLGSTLQFCASCSGIAS